MVISFDGGPNFQIVRCIMATKNIAARNILRAYLAVDDGLALERCVALSFTDHRHNNRTLAASHVTFQMEDLLPRA